LLLEIEGEEKVPLEKIEQTFHKLDAA
jgi:hypothetical protein